MANPKIENPKHNRLLAALPPLVYDRVASHLESVSCRVDDVIFETGESLDSLYFPTTCIVSLVYTTEDGMTTGVGLVGNEGVAGIELFLGAEASINRAAVHMAGGGWWMKAQAVHEEFGRAAAFHRLLLRYAGALIGQISQTAVCNRLHSIEQRLGRWLLMSDDRVRSGDLKLTQKVLSNLLGVRREGVTVAAGHLKEAGLIKYHRGSIMIEDRQGLETCACECYRVVKREYDRLLG